MKTGHGRKISHKNKRAEMPREEPTMKNFRDEVNAVMAALADARFDAEKFDNGNESAGRRARVALRDVEKRCACIRKDILAESKEREEARK